MIPVCQESGVSDSAPEELFAEEDQVLRRSLVLQQNTASTLHDKMKSEESPPVLPSEEPVFCCWGKNDTLPRLSQPSSTLLCLLSTV
ncbi:hypothetical protein G5714_004551 [Onychostoma macrolepis]|uniref:Uncharacterized protein n=1 Tax=Onychostoma macrolepis TaxID=369639 RepID=A0A7J6D4Z9_9TELE|nr:hypothetical protein G5714_004551 [Onychostoma macrolepis]